MGGLHAQPPAPCGRPGSARPTTSPPCAPSRGWCQGEEGGEGTHGCLRGGVHGPVRGVVCDPGVAGQAAGHDGVVGHVLLVELDVPAGSGGWRWPGPPSPAPLPACRGPGRLGGCCRASSGPGHVLGLCDVLSSAHRHGRCRSPLKADGRLHPGPGHGLPAVLDLGPAAGTQGTSRPCALQGRPLSHPLTPLTSRL